MAYHARTASHCPRRSALPVDSRDPLSDPHSHSVASEQDAELGTERAEIAYLRLVSLFATRLAESVSGDLDGATAEALQDLARVLGLEQVVWWRSTERGLVPAFQWAAPGLPAPRWSAPLEQVLPSLAVALGTEGATWLDSLRGVADPRVRDSLRGESLCSLALLPVVAEGRRIGALTLGTARRERAWDPELRLRLRLVARVLALGLAAPARVVKAATASGHPLRRTIVHDRASGRLIAAESEAAREALAQVDSVAPTTATVLLTGETGTGKELFAQAVHDRSPRRDRPMVRVNCAAIPAALIESELFGRERGAYTGALSRQAGRFELANGGTLFLDEIGELPLESQVKLLRAIQDRVVERLGGTDPIHVDVRLIAATNNDLGAAVEARTFREDLYYRLNVFPVHVPPLRERVKDIPVLVWSFVDEFARASGKRIESVAPESMAALQRHGWPGNVRELRNLVERAVILARGPRLVIEPPSGGHGSHAPHARRGTLAEAQVEHIRAVLQQVGWRVRGPGGAAELLGMKPTTLDSRMVKLGIRRPTSR